MSHVNVSALVKSIATRTVSRSEATLQSDIRTLLLWGGLNLNEAQVVALEVPTSDGTRRRIDIEVGLTVIEVKSDLRSGKVRADAQKQLAGYVQAQTGKLGQRYVGVLTDGADWHLYHVVGGTLSEVSEFHINPGNLDVAGLKVWLESILATGSEIAATPVEIERRLGAQSPSYALDESSLLTLWQAASKVPEARVKRSLWAKLLRTAFGTNFEDEDRLFVDHTYLTISAEIIAHAVMGLNPADPNLTPSMLVTGQAFLEAQIRGVVEADFFDWVMLVPGGSDFVASLARRLSRFKWALVEHDVLKVLYESVILPDQRHRLGEYYTPDWLADRVVEATVIDPLNQRVLDPSCGSGTFVFHAVRHFLATAAEAGLSNGEAVYEVTRHVTGVDVHPVAVTLARVTYLLAIGTDRLQADDRGPIAVPVFLGDSLQGDHNAGMLSHGEIRIPTDEEGATLYGIDLIFPEGVVSDAGRFDQLVTALVERATARQPREAIPSLAPIFKKFAVGEEEQQTLRETFVTLCHLHDDGQNHIWGYYVRNLIRPIWLAQLKNKADVLVGNPPWLAYRFMTPKMQSDFKRQAKARGIWTGKAVATNDDLSAFFVARAIELYLRNGGSFAFVMPYAVLSRQQYAGFRSGSWPSPLTGSVNVSFGKAWDLHQVKPSIFPVPAAVVTGRHTSSSVTPLGTDVEHWSGNLPGVTVTWDVAESRLKVEGRAISLAKAAHASPYAKRFTEGATLVPRMLVTVEDAPPSPLGAGIGRRAVRSRRTRDEKEPYKFLASLSGNVEKRFIRRTYLGSTVVPFRTLEPWLAIVTWDGKKLLDGNSTAIDNEEGLAKWWREAESRWNANKSSASKMTLVERQDFHKGLSGQFPPSVHRVVYTKSGMTLAASRVTDDQAVIDHTLYWATTSGVDEGRYLCSIINSRAVLDRVLPLMSRGDFGPRHIDKYLFQVPIPMFDGTNDVHMELARLGEHAEEVADSVPIPAGRGFQAARTLIRSALVGDGVAAEIESAVAALIPQT